MIEEKLEIPGLGAEALLLRGDGDFPGVIFLTDVWGIRSANIGVARRLAEKGFSVLMPNAFYRYGIIQSDGFEPDDAEARNQRLGELFAALTPAQQDSDGAAYVDFLKGLRGVAKGPVGVAGYCYTGMMALRIAAARPDDVAAAASFHGGWLATDKPDSPHLLLPRIKARLYFGHADKDSIMPAEWIARLEAALRDWHGAFQSEVYEGAGHGWTVPGRDVYNELQAERAFEKMVELFETTLEN
jgi:carboxymethylenebutenolidase